MILEFIIIILTMKKLFHISDIHIRNGDKRASRYQEYSTVFDNLFISLKDNIAKYRLNKSKIKH